MISATTDGAAEDMATDFVMVRFGWDSGPFGTYFEESGDVEERAIGVDESVLRVPRAVWTAYVQAREALGLAEEALDAWEVRRLAALGVRR